MHIIYTVMSTEEVTPVITEQAPETTTPVVTEQAPETTTLVVTEQKKCCQCLTDKLNDQDFMQKFNVSISFVLELYRVVMGTMLVMFVPQLFLQYVQNLFY